MSSGSSRQVLSRSPEAQTLRAYLQPFTSMDESAVGKLQSLLKTTVELRRHTHQIGPIQRGSPGAGVLGPSLSGFRAEVDGMSTGLEEVFSAHDGVPGVSLIQTQFTAFRASLSSNFNDRSDDAGYSERVHLLEKLMYLSGVLRGQIEMLLEQHGYWSARVAGQQPAQHVARKLDFNHEADPVAAGGFYFGKSMWRVQEAGGRCQADGGAQGGISISVDLSQHQQCGIAELWDSHRYTDVTFVVEEERVEAHRVILAAQSSYFDRLLFGEMREARTGAEIPLQDASADDFKLLLKFAYTGKLEMEKNAALKDILELLAMADRFGFTLLKTAVGAQLTKHVTSDTVLQILLCTDLCDLQDLHQKCLHYCDEHAAAVLRSESLLSLPEDTLKLVLSRDTLVAAEVSVVEALQRWQESNQRSTVEMKELLDCVRLTRISPDELFQSIEPSGLFTEGQIIVAVRAQTKPQLELTRPRGRKDVNKNLFKTGHATFSAQTRVTFPQRVAAGIQRAAPPSLAESVVSLEEQPARTAGRVGMASAAGLYLNQTLQGHTGQALAVAASPSTSVTVSLKDLFLVNQLMLEGYPDYRPRGSDGVGKKWFSYRVLISLDQQKWTTLFDYSNFHCYSLQQLPFPMQAARYVRFDLTDRSDKTELFSLKFTSFSAMADQKPFHLRSSGVIAPTAPITPKVTTSQVIVNPSGSDSETTILFHQPYSISCMKLRVDDPSPKRICRVVVSVGVAEDSVQKVPAALTEQATRGDVVVSFKETVVSCVVVLITNVHEEDRRRNQYSILSPSSFKTSTTAAAMGAALQQDRGALQPARQAAPTVQQVPSLPRVILQQPALAAPFSLKVPIRTQPQPPVARTPPQPAPQTRLLTTATPQPAQLGRQPAINLQRTPLGKQPVSSSSHQPAPPPILKSAPLEEHFSRLSFSSAPLEGQALSSLSFSFHQSTGNPFSSSGLAGFRQPSQAGGPTSNSPQPAQAGVAGAALAQQEKAAGPCSVVVVEVSNPTS